jgi:hypothetical protein
MRTEREWADYARRELKAKLVLADVDYKELSSRLAKIGVSVTPNAIATKIHRGMFSHVFWLQCESVIRTSLDSNNL